MNKYLLPLIAFLTVVAWSQSSLPVGAQTGQVAAPSVEVWGTAEILTPPTTIEFQVAITTRHSHQEGALKQNDQRLSQLKDMLNQFAVAPESFQVSQVRTHEDRRHHPTRPQVVNRYISFTLGNPEQKDGLLRRFAANKIGEVRSASPRLADPIGVRNKARAQALRAARDKAESMAGALGEKVGRPYNITEIQSNRWSNSTSSNVVTSSGDDSQAVKDGQVSTKATVKVIFLLQR